MTRYVEPADAMLVHVEAQIGFVYDAVGERLHVRLLTPKRQHFERRSGRRGGFGWRAA